MALPKHVHSPYRQFNLEEWSQFREDLPLTMSEEELKQLRGVNEPVNMQEVEKVYLPLSRLLSLYVETAQLQNQKLARFLRAPKQKTPFIIGLAGSVAVGKSTTARILQHLLARWPSHPNVALVATDDFLLPNSTLNELGIMNRKGFPESYNRAALLEFLSDIKGGRERARCPVYSHLSYDVVPDKWAEVDQPDILIIEGLNVLQTGKLNIDDPHVFISDFFDFSIYLDAEEDVIEEWYISRFLMLRKTAFSNPRSYFRDYAKLNREEATETAQKIWADINLVNLRNNIQPTRERAQLILHKGRDHSIDKILLRGL